MHALSGTEQARLIHFLLTDTDTCKLGILLALMTGLRIGEICALRWQDISLTDGTVSIHATMQRIKDLNPSGEKKTRLLISMPKTAHSERVIPLTQQMIALCRRWASEDPRAFVLTGNPQRWMEPRSLQYRLSKYADACGIEGLHFHVLRHTFATRCVEAGFEIKSLSEILGHASPRITMETYVHSSMELKRSNMEKLTISGL